MFKNYSIFVTFLILLFSSCNIIGEKITELSLTDNEISTIENVHLKKGDEVIIWTKVTTNDRKERQSTPVIKYSIEYQDTSIRYDKLNIMNGSHQINSRVTSKSYNTNGENGDSTVYYKQHTFENVSAIFKVPYTGKYNFDFKLTDADFWGPAISIILRKKE